MASSQANLHALDQLQYPCQYDTKALETLEKKIGIKRPRSAPPARRPDPLKGPTITQIPSEDPWLHPGPVLIRGYIPPCFTSVERLYASQQDPVAVDQRARGILLAGEPMAIFPNYFLASPQRPQADEVFDSATIATNEDGKTMTGQAHERDAAPKALVQEDEAEVEPEPEPEPNKTRSRGGPSRWLAENRERARFIRKREQLQLVLRHLAKEALVNFKEDIAKYRERTLTALMLITLSFKHKQLLQHATSASAVRRISTMHRRETVAMTEVRLLLTSSQDVTEPRSLSDGVKHVLERFVSICRRSLLRMKRRRCADMIRLYLNDRIKGGSLSSVIPKFKRRVALIQRQMRHFLRCRQARIRALALIWQDILAKKYIEVLNRQRNEESARLQRALQDPTLKHVVFKLEMSRVGLKEELRKAGGGMLDLEAELLKKLQGMRKPGKDDELSKEEMKFLHEALKVQRRDHLLREDAFWKAKNKVKAASHDDVRTLLEGDFVQLRGLCNSICRAIPRRSSPFSLFTNMGKSSMVYEFLETKAEQYVSAKIDVLKRRELAIVQHRLSLRYGGPSPVHVSLARRGSNNFKNNGPGGAAGEDEEENGRRRSSARSAASSLPLHVLPTYVEGGMGDTPRPSAHHAAPRSATSLDRLFAPVAGVGELIKGPEMGLLLDSLPPTTCPVPPGLEPKPLALPDLPAPRRRSVSEALLDAQALRVMEGLRQQISLLEVPVETQISK